MIIISGADLEEIKNTVNSALAHNKVLVCGAGSIGQQVFKWMKAQGIACVGFVDKKGNVTGLKERVYTYEQVIDNDLKDNTFLLATRFYNKEIANELRLIGVDDNNIAMFEDISVTDEIIFDDTKIKTERKKWIDERFKNIHSNKRAFLIGNGPSLDIKDLELIKGEISFATNGVYQAFPLTSWRPTYFFVMDRFMADVEFKDKDKFEWLLRNSGTVFCDVKTSLYGKYGDSDYDNLYFFKARNISTKDAKSGHIAFSENVLEEAFCVGTSVSLFYQFAAYMGIKEIYLIGMDFDFSRVIKENNELERKGNNSDHASFIKQGNEGIYSEELILKAHTFAREYAKEHGIRIYNATRGGKLEVFDRVNFDKLIAN